MKKKPWIFLILILILVGVAVCLFFPEKDAPDFNPKGVVISEVVFDKPHSADNYCGYDKEGRVVEEYAENHDNVAVIRRHKYDGEGNKILTVSYDENGDISGYISYDFIDEGKHTKMYSFTPSDVLLYADEYEYDHNWNTLKYQHYNEKDELESYTEFKYDENGIQTGYVIYDRDGNVTETCEY
ncbi:MAG: hypothetical protein J6C17_03545 [Clostridia bacterium]|nr:hypothetical protein [Clostridia bacterium]